MSAMLAPRSSLALAGLGCLALLACPSEPPSEGGLTFTMNPTLEGAGDVPSGTEDNERGSEIRVRSGMTPTRAA